MTARERLLWSAVELIRENGVAGTGVAALLDHSGVARRTLYLNFPGGKEQLVEQATQLAGDYITAMLERQANALGMLNLLERYWESELTRSGFSAGCPVLASALASSWIGARETAGVVFESWTQLIAKSLVEQGVEELNARSIATTIIAGFEGAIALCQATHDMEHLHRVSDALRGTLTHLSREQHQSVLQHEK